MENLILGVCVLNLIVTSILGFKFFSLKKSLGELKVEYFPYTIEDERMFKSKKKIQIKAQIFLREIPIGSPIVVSEQIYDSVDKEEVNKALDRVSSAMGKLGLTVVKKMVS